MPRALLAAIVAFLTFALAPAALAQYPFTFQGEIRNGGAPYTGSADFRVTVFDSAIGGNLFAPPLLLTNATVDAQGRFTIKVDFGFPLTPPNGVFLYLLIEVRTPSDPTDTLPFSPLSPRQQMTPAPLATYATLAGIATNATSAEIATNADNLDGQPGSFYLNASNLNAGLIPNSLLSNSVLQLGTPAQAITASKFFLPNTFVLRNAANTRGISFSPAALTADRTITLPDANGTVITSGNRADLTLSGDVTGTAAAVVVSRLQGVSVSSAAPTSGQGLFYNGSLWVPQLAPIPSQPLVGDVQGGYQSNTVRAIQGFSVNPSTPSANNVLVWSGTQWIPQAVPLSFGQGLSQVGTAVSIPNNGIGNTLLAADILSLSKITNGLLQNISGTSLQANGPLSSTANITAGDFAYTAPFTSYVTIPDSAFESRDGVGVTRALGSGGANPIAPGGTSGLTAAVYLPDGAIITGFRAYLIDNNAALNLNCSLLAYDPVGGGSTAVAAVASTGVSAAVQALDAVAINHTVNNTNRAYRVNISTAGVLWADSSASMRAVRIQYTLARPAR